MDVSILGTTLGLKLEDKMFQEVTNWALMGAPPPSPPYIKQMTVLQYVKVFAVKTFIETGTYHGTTTKLVADTGIECKTVELLESLYKAAVQNFANYPNVELFFGDSGQMLGTMVERSQAPHLFWLDGHYSDHTTARGPVDTPIAQELEQLLAYDIENSVILIDDIRDFGRGDYPTVAYLENFVREKLPHHVCQNFGDIMRITPKLNLVDRIHANRAAGIA